MLCRSDTPERRSCGRKQLAKLWQYWCRVLCSKLVTKAGCNASIFDVPNTSAAVSDSRKRFNRKTELARTRNRLLSSAYYISLINFSLSTTLFSNDRQLVFVTGRSKKPGSDRCSDVQIYKPYKTLSVQFSKSRI